ncbi:MAG: hypothetical protein OEW18_03150 [Candidatus Aminicenantes bacterium]|nr:hypothetical protein [Candidatus Aminicenantes bacterium]
MDLEIIRDFSFVLEPRKVLSRIGDKRPLDKIDAGLKRSVEEGKVKLLGLLRPGAIWGIFDYEETNRHPVFERASKVVLAVSTIGPLAEEEIARLFQEGDVLQGLVLDGLASEATKEVIWRAEETIVERSRRMGLWPSRRYSPGYRGWDLCEQRFLFSKIPAERIGVRLTESCMMVPRKSHSMRINLYPDRSMTTRRPQKTG